MKKMLSISFIMILALCGCANNTQSSSSSSIVENDYVGFSENIELKRGDLKSQADWTIFNNVSSDCEYKNKDLQLEVNFQFTNYSSVTSKAVVSNFQAYGNDELLQEKVYKEYNYEDSSLNVVYTSEEFSLAPNESKSISFCVVIPQGNIGAHYDFKFTLNSVTVSLDMDDTRTVNDRFVYVHNPSLNEKVLVDASEDTSAVYGYVPSSTGSLATYSQYDWTNKDEVATYKQSRIDYIEANDAKIKALQTKMEAEGKTIEEIARACSNLRNQNRLDAYKDDPEGLAACKARNLEKYGHEEGPLPEELYEKYGSWETVLEKSYSSNRGMDAICGVYDKYFYLYN